MKKIREPVWKGPEVDGVTQSLLSRFLVCKERFRVLVIEGWAAQETFSLPLHFGQMWHTCEEAYAAPEHFGLRYDEELKNYCQDLCRQLPSQQEQIDKWYRVCLKQFPLYVDYWSKHPDVKTRKPLLQEEVFCVPYTLPSGRVVKLRGKWDSVDLIGRGRKAAVYLQENKTKGRIDEEYLTRQLSFDLQTMIYLIALDTYVESGGFIDRVEKLSGSLLPRRGVRYNVVKRPQLVQRGGRKVNAKGRDGKPIKLEDGTNQKTVQGKESNSQFAKRVEQDILEKPEEYFYRWKVEITQEDINRFKREFLDPCLEHLCLWYDYQVTTGEVNQVHLEREDFKFLHYRLPYGVFNPLLEGKGTDLDEYLLNGSTVGLERVNNLFPELDNA